MTELEKFRNEVYKKVIKANGAWFKVHKHKRRKHYVDYVFCPALIISRIQITGYYYDDKYGRVNTLICLLEDCGKTWALTKKELEK